MTQKTCQEKYMLEYNVNRLTAESIRLEKELTEVKQTLALAQDGIRIALNIAGYNIAEMNQFECASALLDMATEYKAMIDTRNQKQTWEALYVRTWERTLGEGL